MDGNNNDRDSDDKNKALDELTRYALGAVPVMAQVDLTKKEIDFYDKFGKYVLAAIPVIGSIENYNIRGTEEKDGQKN